MGDYYPGKVEYWSKLIDDKISPGRIDYREEFLNSLENFQSGTPKLHNDKLKEDLYLAHFHDKSRILGKGRSIKWASHFKVGKNLKSSNDIELRKYINGLEFAYNILNEAYIFSMTHEGKERIK